MSDSRRYKWYRQRKKRGFDDRELWSLDHTIAEFVLPRLVRFKETRGGYPGCLQEKGDLAVEKWDAILDKIIYSMEAIIVEWNSVFPLDSDGKHIDEKKVRQGLSLFAKYFRHLWW